jgi:TPR repeat protein
MGQPSMTAPNRREGDRHGGCPDRGWPGRALKRTSLTGLTALALLVAWPVRAGYSEGVSAYRADDFSRAFQEFESAAARGDARAQYMLGLMFDHGRGAYQDSGKAIDWYRKSAEQGLACAQRNLGIVYADQSLKSADYAASARWCRKAAEQGDGLAQHCLGLRYANGQGVSKDYREALKWFKSAAEQGIAKAQADLGYMYAQSMGLHRADDEQALMWFMIAAQKGDENARENQAYGERTLPKKQVERAAELAKKWIADHAKGAGADAEGAIPD